MSLVVATYVPEGIVMASDSRQFLNAEGTGPDGKPFKIETVNSDNVTKTFLFEKQRVGVSCFGQDLLKGVPMASHIKKFQEEILEEQDDVEGVAGKLKKFILEEFGEVDTGFHVCGYKKEGKLSIPYVFYIHIKQGKFERRNIKPQGELAYGATWSGQADILTSLLNPVILDANGQKNVIRSVSPIIWDAMPLQDAIDFSFYAIRTTIDTMRFQARPKNVGGKIDALVLCPDDNFWTQKIN